MQTKSSREGSQASRLFLKLFYIWNTAVTYKLEELMEVVPTVLEVRLEQFMTSNN